MDGSRQDGRATARGSDLRFIARGFGAYRKDAVLAGLCVFVETSLELLIPFLMSSVIDEGISGASPYVVWTRGAAMLGRGGAASGRGLRAFLGACGHGPGRKPAPRGVCPGPVL